MKPNALLKRARELRGWSQARVAEEIGTTALNVGRWERGTSMPYPHYREKLCLLFGKDASELGLLEMETEVEVAESLPVEDDAPVPGPPNRVGVVYDPAIPLLPSGSGRLVGRDELLARLRRRLCDEVRPVMLALHGLPGVGKTALATELAYDAEIRAHFRDGILWAAPGLSPDIPELLSRWGAVLGMPAATVNGLDTAENWVRALRATIGQRQMLLVVDDAWKIEEALAFQVGGPHCAYLVTTRYPHLAVQLAAEDAQAVPELTEQDGVALLARYAAEFVKSAPETALALVHSVGALPLALTLMGKYLSVQVYSGQPRRLHAAVEHFRDARVRLQLSETRPLAERHPSLTNGTTLSLQSLIAVSEQLLDEYARAALRALSLFPAKPNSFAEEAALEVCQISVETLDALCDSGLLECNGPSRYMLHQTISDYARVLLTDPAVSERLVNYYVRFVETHTRDHTQLDLEISNILAALEITSTSHRREELLRCVCALADFLYIRGLYGLAEKHLKRAYEAAKVLSDHQHMVTILIHLGAIEQAWGNLVQAEALLLEGLELARKMGSEEQICDLLRNIGIVEDCRGNLAQAEACLREGLELARKLGQQEQICRLLANLGSLISRRSDFAQAEACFQEGLALAHKLEYSERIAGFLTNLGRIEYARGNYNRAEKYYQDALKRTRRLGFDAAYGSIQVRLGELALRQGQFARSRACLEEASKLLRELGQRNWLNDALYGLGELAVAEGNDEGAQAYFQEGLELSQHSGERELISASFTRLAQVEIRRGNYEQAEHYLREAQTIAHSLGLSYLLGLTFYARGELSLSRQLLDEASQQFSEMRKVVSHEQRELQALALFGLARAARERHELPAAHQHGEASLALFATISHYQAQEVRDWLEQL